MSDFGNIYSSFKMAEVQKTADIHPPKTVISVHSQRTLQALQKAKTLYALVYFCRSEKAK